MSVVPSTQYAVQFTGVDEITINPAKPVASVGPHGIMLQIEACGICFSDTKLLHAFDSHPRKSEVVSGLTEEELAEIPGYQPGSLPTVPGHEPVARIIEVGEKVTHFRVGERVLVQADWKHLPTAKSNAAFGYNFEGALQEFVVVDERCIVAPNGDEFLIRVAEEPTAAAIGLIEPWATVEGAYAWRERRTLKAGGHLLVVADADAAVSSIADLVAEAAPGEITAVGTTGEALGVAATTAASLAELGEQRFDDIIYFGADAGVITDLGARLAARSIFNIVLGGKRIEGVTKVDVGRVHYDFIRYCGTTGSDPAAGYAWIPETGEVRAGDKLAIMGAAGPMGLMHTMRAVVLGLPDISIDATDLSASRLEHLASVIDPVAAETGVPVTYLNTSEQQLEAGYSYVVVMVPAPPLIAEAVTIAGEGAIVNAFAGIPAGTLAEIDVQGVIERQIFMIGTSGSDVSDMRTVVNKIERGDYDTTISLDSITGMAGFNDAINAVINRTSGGKIMVYPQLHDLPLIALKDLADHLPEVAAKLEGGLWTRAAEEELLRGGNGN